ncbi:hypothetical protein OIU83_01740 [Flavobacterium sp. LS1R49]|uniref:Uncharacterized protein n=1 Tax=Flavobacterium shii TaxID=2987687 RepID=A0A9X2ZD52_9FLAO|nr:hypothetical protein [Flavobacterium shii]MCV9926357.1 hypothetical protein [Flavobacterium shii]
MIIKNHTIELKDTSASEMARFRQIMLGIWRQQIEDDKNGDEMLKYVESSNNYSDIKFVSVYEVIECIKRKIGYVYPNTSFSKLIDGPIKSTPEKLGTINYNDSQGAQKQGGISLEWNTFNGINLIAKTFKPSIEIGKYHTDFSLTIFDNNLKEIAFKFTVQDFDLYIALFDLLGIVITSDVQIIINLYLKKIKEANNNPSKLDVIYESLPRTLFGKMNDQQLYEHLDLLLNDVSYLEVIAPTNLDTNEDKAILQILYAINDRQLLYLKLRYSDLLYRIYNKLHGEEVQDLLRFLTRLVAEFDTSKPSDIVYFDNSYYLFRDTHLETDWSGKKILVNNYRNETQTIITYDKAYVPMELDSNMYSSPVQKVTIPKQYINKSFNPLAKLNFGTKLGDLGDQIGDDNTFVIALKIHDMATKQSNWDLFNIATDLLSLLSAYGALRIVLAKGAPIAARVLAGVVLAKDATHYAMLSNGTLEKWHKNGYSWLANLWIAFSVTVDLASFGLPNLSKIAKEGNTAAELAETAEDAREIRRVADEANKIIDIETGKDVSKMTEKELDDFIYRQDDRPHSPTGKMEGRIKSHVNSKGEIEPANINGKTTVQQHIRGSEPVKSESPYTSFSLNNLGTGANKSYGNYIIEVDIKKLKKDINAGLVKDVQILKHEEVLSELQEKIDIAQNKVDLNPSKKNLDSLDKTKQDFTHSTRDKEVLIKGIVPSKYIKVKPQKK